MKYFALLTTYGEKVLAEATALGTKIELTHMSVGDGGGSLPAPDTKQTKLINERRKAAINTLFIDPLNPNQIIAEQVIPENEGGWWIREIGLFDKSGALVAIANCPETYKPLLVEGSGRTQTIRVVLIVSHTESVTLKIDPTVVLATRKYVDDAIEVLDKKIKELTAKDVGAVPTTDVVQSTGQSTTQIMSQKAATTAIADAKKAGTDAQNAANSAASAASAAQLSANSAASAASNANSNANDRLPKTDVVQSTGQSTTQVMSQKAATTAIADAKKAGTDAQNAANSAASAASAAQSSANSAASAAGAAQSTANAAKSAADSANNNANGRVPNTRKVNGKPLSGDINLGAGDVGSYTKQETINLLVGNGQSQQDVTASRAKGTVYTNSTGKLIFVAISTTYMRSSGIANILKVNNRVFAESVVTTDTLSADFLFAPVPNGGTYEYTGKNVKSWVELR